MSNWYTPNITRELKRRRDDPNYSLDGFRRIWHRNEYVGNASTLEVADQVIERHRPFCLDRKLDEGRSI